MIDHELLEELRLSIYSHSSKRTPRTAEIIKRFTEKMDGFRDRERRMVFGIIYWLSWAIDNKVDFQVALLKIPVHKNRDELHEWYGMDVRNFTNLKNALDAGVGATAKNPWEFMQWIMSNCYCIMGNHLIDAINEVVEPVTNS